MMEDIRIPVSVQRSWIPLGNKPCKGMYLAVFQNLKKPGALFFFLFLVSSIFPSNGQDSKLFRYSFSADFSIPSITSSRLFNQIFDGVADINTSFKIHTRKGIFFGPGFSFCFLKAGNNRNASLSPFHTKYYIVGPRLSGGFISGNSAATQITFSCEIGYSTAILSGTPCTTAPVSPKPFFHAEPSIGLRFFSGERSSFGARLGYSFIDNRFRPEDACLEKFVNYQEDQIKHVAQYLTFGLGFSVYFKSLKPKAKSES
jgi:hypothetical protein